MKPFILPDACLPTGIGVTPPQQRRLGRMRKFVVIASPGGAKQSQCMGLLRRFAPRNDNVSPPMWHVTQPLELRGILWIN